MDDQAKTAKHVRVERIEITDRQGRILAVIGAEQGVPYMARYDGKGHLLSWLTFRVDGSPDVRVFSRNGDQSRFPIPNS